MKTGEKALHSFWGQSTVSRLIEKKMSRKRKIKVKCFPGVKAKDMYKEVINS